MSLAVSPPPPRGGKSPTVGGRGAPLHHTHLHSPRNSMAITNTKGLLNMPGQNNCFLNSAVQVLWHLDIFRRSFRELSGHACMEESCIFCALKELFAQFEYSQESALPPDALRRALAETFCDQRRFQLGFMDDAAECFENILMRIHFHIANSESEDMCSASHCIPHQKFAMTLVEQTVCHLCGATSEPLPFTQMVHYVPSSALCSQAKLMKEKNEAPGFSELLRRAGGLGDLRDCPSSCGAVIQIRKTLMNRPEIVSIGLVWDSERPTIEHITDVFKTIGMSLKLQDVFHSVVDSRWAVTATHQLVGIVTYYGKHYSTFFFHTKLRVWIYFDDAAVREIGPKWEQVVEKCCRGHFQPLLLLYSNPHGSPVVTSTAPRVVTGVPGHKKNANAKEFYNVHSSPEKKCRSFQISSLNNQRRAVTPNPEATCDLNANVQPRRAVTPSGELLWCDDNNREHGKINENTSTQKGDSVKPQPSIQPYYHPHLQKSDQTAANSGISILQGKAKLSPTRISMPNKAFYKETVHKELNRIHTVPFSSRLNPTVDDVLQSSRIEMNKVLYGKSDQNSTDSSNGNTDNSNSNNDSTYISRKTVENVLKLQRQKSMSAKHGHVFVGQRNSSSSLESLDNVFVLQEKGMLGLRLDIPDAAYVARRRDSGNWSGDRNSASSSSTTSLDNPYFYVHGNKRPLNGTRSCGRLGVPENGSITDAGYDSFSLSSSDSYPSAITNSPNKGDSRLGKIPENTQTAFMPYDLSQLQYCLKDLKGHENFLFGFKNECDKLCAEADIFVAKSVERENAGDISMAALLSDTAAAKARAAMDVPYSNSQSLAMAKMKHSMCLIRSSNLHKKLKEAEAILRRKQKEENQLNSPDAKTDNKDRFLKKSEDISKEQSEEVKSSDKSIEIYATLPKKSFKKKGALSSFVDSLTGDDSSDEKEDKQSSSIPEGKGLEAVSSPTAKEEKQAKSPGSKKKSRSSPKVASKDSDLSDYSSEWETTKKSSLYRTYSGPPTNRNSDGGSNVNQSFSEQTNKKQHKIRRKLMGGFMRRKNRSLPDLREGQDSGNEAMRSYDDCFYPPQTPVSCRKLKNKDFNREGSSDNADMPIQSISILSDASKVLKSISRSQTPPPYKPPPPITSTTSAYGSSPKKEMSKLPVLSPLPSNGGLPFPREESHNGHHHRLLCRDSKSSQGKNSHGYSELPRNSAVWLKELQMKQEELNQRRKLQEEREKWLQDFNCGLDKKYGYQQKVANDKSLCLKGHSKIPGYADQNPKTNQSPAKKTNEPEKGPVNQESPNKKTVRDLKSKFEQISHSPPQTSSSPAEPSEPLQGHSPDLSGTRNDFNSTLSERASLSESEPETKSNSNPKPAGSLQDGLMHHSSLGRRCNTNGQPTEVHSVKHCASSNCNTENNKGVNKQHYSSHSTSGCSYNPHLTDAQLTNVLRIGTNRTSFRNANAPSMDTPSNDGYHLHVNDRQWCLFQEARRPDKPPDYETAIQRLELLRNDHRGFSKFCSNSCSSFEALLEQAKRRRGPKKCVTFSDKVVLVACAGDEDNDFIPNPLLERVYKQHLMQKEGPSTNAELRLNSIAKDSTNAGFVTDLLTSPNSNLANSPNTNAVLCPKTKSSQPSANVGACPNTNSMTCSNTNSMSSSSSNSNSLSSTNSNSLSSPNSNSMSGPNVNSVSCPNTNSVSCSNANSVSCPKSNSLSSSAKSTCPSTNSGLCPIQNSVPCPKSNSVSSEGEKLQGFSGNFSPCHLCHKKIVDAKNLYCPDCAYYMSRFQQK